jgi:ribosomal-protein-serine acetyltransferase
MSANQSRSRDACANCLAISDAAYLRLLDKDDARTLHALIEANRARLARWLPWAATQTFEDTLGFIRRTEEQTAANDGFQTAIICEGDLAGVIGYVGINWQNRSTSIGYWLGERYQGKGTMTKAVSVLVDHALSTWKLNRVEIRAGVENRSSRAIAERLGFRQEGILRQAELIEGRYLDCVVYSMLAE